MAQREGRGTLKVFLGAAPGVGKTYEMLRVGQAQKAEGIDVVAGIIETHGRDDTAALIPGPGAYCPAAKPPIKAHIIEEMDLDAILARRPPIGAG